MVLSEFSRLFQISSDVEPIEGTMQVLIKSPFLSDLALDSSVLSIPEGYEEIDDYRILAKLLVEFLTSTELKNALFTSSDDNLVFDIKSKFKVFLDIQLILDFEKKVQSYFSQNIEMDEKVDKLLCNIYNTRLKKVNHVSTLGDIPDGDVMNNWFEFVFGKLDEFRFETRYYALNAISKSVETLETFKERRTGSVGPRLSFTPANKISIQYSCIIFELLDLLKAKEISEVDLSACPNTLRGIITNHLDDLKSKSRFLDILQFVHRVLTKVEVVDTSQGSNFEWVYIAEHGIAATQMFEQLVSSKIRWCTTNQSTYNERIDEGYLSYYLLLDNNIRGGIDIKRNFEISDISGVLPGQVVDSFIFQEVLRKLTTIYEHAPQEVEGHQGNVDKSRGVIFEAQTNYQRYSEINYIYLIAIQLSR